jgi:hypothetical protein
MGGPQVTQNAAITVNCHQLSIEITMMMMILRFSTSSSAATCIEPRPAISERK